MLCYNFINEKYYLQFNDELQQEITNNNLVDEQTLKDLIGVTDITSNIFDTMMYEERVTVKIIDK